MGSHILEVIDLECIKCYSTLFHSVSFALAESQALHVKGANGSGKTSLLRIVAGLSRPESGVIKWRDRNIIKDRSSYLENIVYQAHHNGIKKELTARENLLFASSIQMFSRKKDIDHAFEKLDITHISHLPCHQLSAGQRQRVTIARVVLSNAKLWILDEPDNALDKTGIRILEECIINHMEGGGMVVFSSHHAIQLGTFQPLELVLESKNL